MSRAGAVKVYLAVVPGEPESVCTSVVYPVYSMLFVSDD